jgi:hypothetical protein
MKTKRIVFVRLSSRCLPDQLKYIKALAKKLGISEGAAHREVIDYYIKNN